MLVYRRFDYCQRYGVRALKLNYPCVFCAIRVQHLWTSWGRVRPNKPNNKSSEISNGGCPHRAPAYTKTFSLLTADIDTIPVQEDHIYLRARITLVGSSRPCLMCSCSVQWLLFFSIDCFKTTMIATDRTISQS